MLGESFSKLPNANLMSEVKLGQMIETRVNPRFELKRNLYSQRELDVVDRTVDLLSRIKNTDQAEMMMTVMVSFNPLIKNSAAPTEEDILKFVMDWKRRWLASKEKEVVSTIRDLSRPWVCPQASAKHIFPASAVGALFCRSSQSGAAGPFSAPSPVLLMDLKQPDWI